MLGCEQRRPGNEPSLKRPGQIIEDLEPDERASETVMGTAGESQDDKHELSSATSCGSPAQRSRTGPC